jgi:aldehyde dehydrogenase (NAD+)
VTVAFASDCHVYFRIPTRRTKAVQIASTGNMKQTWVMPVTGELPEMDEILRHATQVKNIWVPYGG